MSHPLVSKLAVAVVRRAADGKRDRSQNESPPDSELVDNGTAKETYYSACSQHLPASSTDLLSIPVASMA